MKTVPFIVLVEDNVPDVFLVRIALEQAGFEFRLQVFADGDEAFDYLADAQRTNHRPDLLLIDLNLPRRSGKELLQGLLDLTGGPLPSFIIISSSDSPDDKLAARNLGAAHFFRKPAELDEFMQLGKVVAKLLESNDSGQRV